jgi:hypothetical protein
MAVNDHTNTSGVKLKVTTEGAGLADKVGTALAHNGVEAVAPIHERPASRITDHGPSALSDAELLALAPGQHDLEVCERSLHEYQGCVGLLRADFRAVAAGIGTPRKAVSLKAALEIGRRLMVAGYEGRFQCGGPTRLTHGHHAVAIWYQSERQYFVPLNCPLRQMARGADGHYSIRRMSCRRRSRRT